ncbi:MAG TPA: PxKF domain-containing protein, partial [Candidatus Limnocylindrales bacterium]
MRGRTLARIAAAMQAILVAGALIVPASAAAATLGFTLDAPSLSTVNYSDFVVLHGAYTCLDDSTSLCPTSIQSLSATFSVRPSGGDTFLNVGTVATSFNFTGSPGGCATTCSQGFQLTWKAGRALGVTVPPGLYDVGLTTTISDGQLVLLGAVTVDQETTTTTYTGLAAGMGNTALALKASVVDQDLGQAPGTGIFGADANLAGSNEVTFELFDATNTTSVAGPVSAFLAGGGSTTGSPTLLLPAAGGTLTLRTTFVGNSFYTTSSDLDTITVTPSNTPPVLTVPSSPVIAEATSPAGAAVSYAVSATDVEDDPAPTPTCAPVSGSVFATGDTTVNCSVTDSGGLSDTDSFTVRVVDTTDPGVSISTAERDNGAGWHNIASNDGTPGVTVDVSTTDLVGVTSLSCTDNGTDVGSLAPSGDSFVIGDGMHAIACTATDGAGNHASDNATFDVDQTAPTISASLSPNADISTGWWNAATGAPTVAYTCSDDGSGVASCSAPFTFGEGADQGASGTAVDIAGNSNTASVSNVDVDLTGPSAIAFVGGGLTGGASYVFGSVPASPTSCTATDPVSGLASCTVSGYSNLVGSYAVTASAVDTAGNASSSAISYTVRPWTLVGFGNSISLTGLNTAKGGSTVNLKVEVFAGSTRLSGPDTISMLLQAPASCSTATPLAPPSLVLSAKGSSLAFDSNNGQYLVKWAVPSSPGSCWVVAVVTADGSSLQATFQV